MKFKKKISNKNEDKIKTRKELRKEKRQEKKQKKNEYFANRKLNKINKNEEQKLFKAKNKKKNQEKENIDVKEEKEKKNLETTESILEKQRNEEKQMQKKIQMGSKTVRKKHLISANEDEDKEIKRLEKLLNMNKRKSKKIPSSFVSDGLDYLLELCDSEKRKEISEYESQTRLSEAESDFEQDLAEVTGRKVKKTIGKKKAKKVVKNSNSTDDSENSNTDFETEDDFNDDDKPLEIKIKRNPIGKHNTVEEHEKDITENDSDLEMGDFDDEEEGDEEDDDDELESNDEENDFEDENYSEYDESANEIDNIDDDSDNFDNNENCENNDEFKGFESDDSIHESDFDENFDEETDFEDEEMDEIDAGFDKKFEESSDSDFKQKKTNKKSSKEERMKALMGFVNKEKSEKNGKTKRKTEEETSEDSWKKRVKFADDFIESKQEQKLSKEERMKALMGFVDKETKSKENKVEKVVKSKDQKLSKEERMKALMGFVNKETKTSEDKKGKTSNEDKNGKIESKEERMKKLLGFVNDEKENSDEDEEEEEDDGTWEDIYGRSRDKDGNIVQTKSSSYIPPHLRASSTSTNSEALILLKRTLKGLLNRLTENNIKSISIGVENLYNQHSRHDTNQTLLSLLKDSLLGVSLASDKMIMEHALLVTILHANVGTEIGATLIQSLVQEFHHLFKSHQVDNKRLDNYISLLIGLYQFKVISHNLLYDLVQLLIDNFNEKTIELILSVLKTIGLSLRKDNPVRFKSALLDIQSRASASTALADTPRTRFMLDILLAVKNNNVHKIPGYDVTMVTRMRGLLKFLIRPSCYVTELNISLQDLLRADEKGRWWIVGSAWTGKDQENSDSNQAKPVRSAPTEFSAAILELARKQRMNTDVRRNAFCVLMSSEDYLDAYEKLLKLTGGKQDQNSGEVVNVIVHCLLNEKRYNPYYTHLGSRFISSNRRYRMLFQYSIWDRFKLINSMKPVQIVNLAKFLSALFVQMALPVSVLKVIEFTELQKPHVRLVRQIFLALLLLEDAEPLRIMFEKVARGSDLRLLKEGLHLFLVTFVMNKLGEDGGSESVRMRSNANLVLEILAPR